NGIFFLFSSAFFEVDTNENRTLDCAEFRRGLKELEFPLASTEVEALFRFFDRDDSGAISHKEFLRALRPPMSEKRKKVVTDTFHSLDKAGDGALQFEDMRKVFKAEFHPKFKTGEWTKDQVHKELLKVFDSPKKKDGKVTLEEFMDYYTGISASVENEQFFKAYVENSWAL
uniref:Calcyphosine n=1 Tax=Latimeria chalumnae TaxID=7897 RepID=H3B0R2_LATCH